MNQECIGTSLAGLALARLLFLKVKQYSILQKASNE